MYEFEHLNPAGKAPLRRDRSVRRTSSLEMTWPDGVANPVFVRGHARDVYTERAGSEPSTLAEDWFTARADQNRRVLSIDCVPSREEVSGLLNLPSEVSMRKTLDTILSFERDAGSPLYLLLDDLPAGLLIAPWVWAQWGIDNLQHRVEDHQRMKFMEEYRTNVEGVCIGFRKGSSALAENPGITRGHKAVPSVINPDDPAGWHEMGSENVMSMRRVRRIDLWRDEQIYIDSSFQDSGSLPKGGRVAVHEYTLKVTADPQTLRILDVQALPNILPHPECPAAVENVGLLVGHSLGDLRRIVPKLLRRTAGCTHLNDAIRALSEVPQLLRGLEACNSPR